MTAHFKDHYWIVRFEVEGYADIAETLVVAFPAHPSLSEDSPAILSFVLDSVIRLARERGEQPDMDADKYELIEDRREENIHGATMIHARVIERLSVTN